MRATRGLSSYHSRLSSYSLFIVSFQNELLGFNRAVGITYPATVATRVSLLWQKKTSGRKMHATIRSGMERACSSTDLSIYHTWWMTRAAVKTRICKNFTELHTTKQNVFSFTAFPKAKSATFTPGTTVSSAQRRICRTARKLYRAYENLSVQQPRGRKESPACWGRTLYS